MILTYLEEEGVLYVVGSYAGEDRDPDWWKNLQKTPRAVARIKRDIFIVTAREVVGSKRKDVWSRFVAIDNAYRTYQERLIPVVALARDDSAGQESDVEAAA